MIYTITLNPSLDRVIWVKALQTDDSIRIDKEKHYAGGKGIDASRVINSLGGETVASGFLGSFTGLHLEGLLINEGVTCDFVKIKGETRSNVIVFNEQSSGHMAFNSRGPEITPYDLASLFHKIENMSSKPSFVIIGGSIPKSLNPNLYAQLIYSLREKGIKVALDADNEPLKLGIEKSPFLIKPNSHEFARLVGYMPETPEDFIKAGWQFLDKGVETMIISRGAKGLLVFNREKAYSITPPKIQVQSTIGSGDSTLAAFVLGLEQGQDLAESGKMGVAAGAATAMSPGVELVNAEDYRALLSQVACQELSMPVMANA